MTKLVDLISDLDTRIERKRAREEETRKLVAAREQRAREERAADDAEHRARQAVYTRRSRAKTRGEEPPAPDDPGYSREQQDLLDRLRDHYGEDAVTVRATLRGGTIIVQSPPRPMEHTGRFTRVTRAGNTYRFGSLEGALRGDERGDQARVVSRARVEALLAEEYVPADHLRPHAWRGEYEPGFEPTETILSDWRIAAARDPADGPSPEMARVEAWTLLRELPERERLVMALRYGIGGVRPMTLQAVAEHMDLTRERVRQIENESLKRMRRAAKGEDTSKPRRRRDAFVFTAEQEALALAGRASGLTQAEVADALDVSVQTLGKALRRAGIKWKQPRKPVDQEYVEALSRKRLIDRRRPHGPLSASEGGILRGLLAGTAGALRGQGAALAILRSRGYVVRSDDGRWFLTREGRQVAEELTNTAWMYE